MQKWYKALLGTTLAFTAVFAACSDGESACTPTEDVVCTNGKVYKVDSCGKILTDQLVKDCEGKPCNAAGSDCESGGDECTPPCDSLSQFCDNGDCKCKDGYNDCIASRCCKNGAEACRNKGSSLDCCTTKASQICEINGSAGKLYYQDSCGNKEDPVPSGDCPCGCNDAKTACKECTGNCDPACDTTSQFCEGTTCKCISADYLECESRKCCPKASQICCDKGTKTCCDIKSEQKCESSAVYWYDCCGTKGEKVKDCTAGCNTAGSDCEGGGGDDNADFVSDVTIPDGTEMNPNTSFDKTWELKNIGTTTWTKSGGYTFKFVTTGNQRCEKGHPNMAAVSEVQLGDSDSIAPSANKQWTVSMTAPATAGTYDNCWQMHRNGVPFGDVVWVEIVVKGGCTPNCGSQECGEDPVCQTPCGPNNGSCQNGWECDAQGLCTVCDSNKNCGSYSSGGECCASASATCNGTDCQLSCTPTDCDTYSWECGDSTQCPGVSCGSCSDLSSRCGATGYRCKCLSHSCECDTSYDECGSTCCMSYEDCCAGRCCSSGSCTSDMSKCCDGYGQTACGSACCNSGETCCGGSCCPSGNCVSNVCQAPGDTCDSPIIVPYDPSSIWGFGGGRFTGSLQNAHNDYPPTNPTGFEAPGKDIVFKIHLKEGRNVVFVSTTGSDFEAVVYSTFDIWTIPLVCGQFAEPHSMLWSGNGMTLSIDAVGVDGEDVFLILDSVDPNASGNYVINIYHGLETDRGGGEHCGEPMDYQPFTLNIGTTQKSGYLCPNTQIDYQDHNKNYYCSALNWNGRDLVYAFVVPQKMTVSITGCGGEDFDSILELRKACSDSSSSSSIACDDDSCAAPNDKKSALPSVTLDKGLYFLWLDSWEDKCGWDGLHNLDMEYTITWSASPAL